MWLLYALFLAPAVLGSSLETRKFPLEARQTNTDGSLPTYKNPQAAIEDRVEDLLARMTLEEKVAQLIQGDINGWMDMDDPLDNTLTYNQTGLEEMMRLKGGSIWGGYLVPYEKFVYGVEVGQRYLMENTTLGIPALIQSEGLHGFTNNGTIFPSPIGLAASFNRDLITAVAGVVSDEAEGLGINHIFAPVLDLGRELRFGRVEEGFGEDHFLTGEMGFAFVKGIQDGARRNVTAEGSKRMAATCKHFAAFGSPITGLNLAPVVGGERDLRMQYLPPFQRACLESLSIMTAYSCYDGIPAVANKHLLTDILRNEWKYPYWVTSDAGGVDLLQNQHFVCETRECSAKTAVENYSGEMGGGTYTYLTLVDQVNAGKVDIKYIDETVKSLLRTKFTLGLFENPYPYADYQDTIRTPKSREVLHTADSETIVLLENHDNTLPLSKDIGSVALIGPQANRVTFGDYVFFNASLNGITPLEGFKQFLRNASSSTTINYAEGCKLWSNDESGFGEAVNAAKSSDVAIVMVGTWSRDQTELWAGLNATTGEHVDVHDLGLVGAQLRLVQAVKAAGKPTIVVFVSGRPVAEPWIQDHADAVIQQFYPGELGGLALAEIVFGAVNPSGKLPVSYPRDVGTTPIFYNYLKGSRPIDAGAVLDDGTMIFGHQYVLNSPVPLWSFGHGLSYTTFNYTDLTLSSSSIGTSDDFSVTVTVHNTGSVDGQEVYVTDVVSSAVVPNQQLAGFEKIHIAAGASQTVTVDVKSSQVALWSVENKWVVEPGTFIVKVGTSDQTFARTNLIVTA
ncbi:glycoside hydrolase family 3 protein [Moniliophthora roreri]|uniref:Fibronectin type III-like domain-containing protein n=1 Tax=Moniliophthora roreri TaxID=221103 RepID=A0A0W0G1P4_MONRR|nr:glycoside hydrolase family 3 protein [Moniliophthora roreri]